MGLTKSLILDSEWPKRILVEASGSPKEGCSHTGEQEGNLVLYNQPKSSHTRSLAISGGFASFFPRLPPEVLLYIHHCTGCFFSLVPPLKVLSVSR